MNYDYAMERLGLTPRVDQREYTGVIQEYLTSHSTLPLLLSAETGIGKTLGYIIPALEHTQTDDGKILLVTDTKANREIISSEANRTAELLGIDVSACVIRSRYDFMLRSEILRWAESTVLTEEVQTILDFLHATPDEKILMDDFPVNPYHAGLDHSETLYPDAVVETQDHRDSRIHVITHAMLVYNLDYRYNISQGGIYSLMVIDEMHSLTAMADQLEKSENSMEELRNTLRKIDCRSISTHLRSLIQAIPMDTKTGWVEFDPKWFRLVENENTGECLDEFRATMKDAIRKLERYVRSGDSPDLKMVARGHVRGLRPFANALNNYGAGEFDRTRYMIHRTPSDTLVSTRSALPGLKQLSWIWSLGIPVVATTAKFNQFKSNPSGSSFFNQYGEFFRLCGLTRKFRGGTPIHSLSRSIILKDYGSARFVTYRGFSYTTPLNPDTFEYIPAHVELCRKTVEPLIHAGENAVILVTSFRKSEQLRDALRGIPVFAQEAGSTKAIEQFKNTTQPSVLITTRWVGLDLPGMVNNLIVPQLPHAPPEQQHRVIAATSDAWARHLLRIRRMNDVLLRMYQGMGRLIRGADDHGRVFILDPRMPPIYGPHPEKQLWVRDAYPVRFRKLAESIMERPSVMEVRNV